MKALLSSEQNPALPRSGTGVQVPARLNAVRTGVTQQKLNSNSTVGTMHAFCE
jgi:hypothetical protein